MPVINIDAAIQTSVFNRFISAFLELASKNDGGSKSCRNDLNPALAVFVFSEQVSHKTDLRGPEAVGYFRALPR